jgi:threonine dehydrogenase-like Zn-dependent dehydrogenase
MTNPAIMEPIPITINANDQSVSVMSGHDTVMVWGAGRVPSLMMRTLTSSGTESETLSSPSPEYS